MADLNPTAAVVVIDLQTGMFDGVAEPPLHDADGLVERVRMILEWARRTHRKIAFIRHDGPEGDSLTPGAPGWPIWPALGQAEHEPTFAKSVGDAFSNVAFGQWLADQHASVKSSCSRRKTRACVSPQPSAAPSKPASP